MRKILIVVGILVLVVLGFIFLSNMTGNTITGAVVDDGDMENEYFRIDPVGYESNGAGGEDGEVNEEDLNGSQNSTEPKVPYK